MKQKRNTQKGITLIALMITIIILLILAMVSISLVINQGILDKAKYGVDKYKEEETAEQEKLTQVEEEMKKYGGNTPAEVVEPEIGSYIKYNVPYTDMYSEIEYTETTGWRYLGKDDSGNQLIISTGIPLILNYNKDGTNGTWWEQGEGNPNARATNGMLKNFESIKYKKQATGTEVSDKNTMIGRFDAVTEDGTLGIKFRASNIEANEIKGVRTLTLAELNKACTKTGFPRSDDDTSEGFVYFGGVASNLFGMEFWDYGVQYWLGTPNKDYEYEIMVISHQYSDEEGDFFYMPSNVNSDNGIRPVVVLSPNFQLEIVQ